MSTRRLAALLVFIILVPFIATLTTSSQPTSPELEVVPSTGRGRYGEEVTVKACGLRPGATVVKIDFQNQYTGQVYTFSVNAPIDDQGCFSVELVLGNMSYGAYDVVVYEQPPSPPGPLESTGIIRMNETDTLTVDARPLEINASVSATFHVIALWDYRYHKRETDTTGAVVSFTAEDGKNYTLVAFITLEPEMRVFFLLFDAEGNLVDTYNETPKEVDGAYVAEWEFNLAEPEVLGLGNNKAVFTFYPQSPEDPTKSKSVLDLYYGGRKISVIESTLTIIYVNYDTGETKEFIYEYPDTLIFGDYGLEPVTTYWVDADISWTAVFEWDAITGEAKLTVHAEYLPRTLLFEGKYRIEPVIYINGEQVENLTTLRLWTVYEYTVELYGFTPGELFIIEVDGNVIHHDFIDVDGNASYTFTVPLHQLERGYWHAIRITGYYSNGVEVYEYVVTILIAHPAIFVDYVLVEPGGTAYLGYVCPGRSVVIEASGFPPYTPVAFYINGQPVDTLETNENGILARTLIIGELPFKYNATNELTVLAVYDSMEYYAYVNFTIPGIFVDGTLVGFDEVHDVGVVAGARPFVVEAFNFPPNTTITVYLNNDYVGTYYTDIRGYARIILDAHRSMHPSTTGVYTIVVPYDGCIYEAQTTFIVQEIVSYFNIVNPITLELKQETKASAGYFNQTLIAALNGEPFDYLGDYLEISILEGLAPGERVAIWIRGLRNITLYSGVVDPNGQLFLRRTVPSLPKGTYGIEIELLDRGYSIIVPWFYDETVTTFEVYPKILVTRLDSYEIPKVLGSVAVRVFGSGFDANIVSGFIVLLNETDAIAAVNFHTYMFWRTNEWGLLVGPGGSQTGLTIPLLEPGVYAITLHVEGTGYAVGTGYVIVENNLANVATKEDVEEIKGALETIALNLDEVLARLDTIEYTLSEVASNVMELLERQDYIIEILELLKEVVATKEDIHNIISYLESIEFKIDDLYSTMIALYEQLNARIDDLEMYLATLISELESKLLNRTYELEELMTYLYTLLLERIDSLELALLDRIAESESNIIQMILEVEQGLMKKLSDLIDARTEYLEALISNVNETILAELEELKELVDERTDYLALLIEDVNASLNARLAELEEFIDTRISDIEMQLSELATLILDVHDSLQSRINQLEETLTNIIIELEYSIMARIDELESSMKDYIDVKTEYLASLIESVNTTILARVDRLESSLNASTTYLETLILSVNETLTSLVNAKAEYLESIISDVNASLHASLLALKDYVESRLDELTQLVTNVNATLNTRLDQLVSLISDVNSTIMVELDVIKSLVNASTTHLETKIENINRTLTDLIVSRTESLASMVRDVNATLVSMINNVTALIYERTGRLESLITTVNETISTRIAGLEARVITEFDSVKAMISGVNATLAARVTEVNTTLYARIDRLESLVIREVDALEGLVNTTRRELIDLVNATARYITDYISREIDALESQLVANMTVLGGVLRLYIDERISELNESILATLRLYDGRFEYIEEVLANVTSSIEDLRSDMYTEVRRVRTELDVKHDEMSEKIGELDEKVGVAISTSEEARSLASTTMTISTVTLVLVVASLAIAVLTFMKLRKAK